MSKRQHWGKFNLSKSDFGLCAPIIFFLNTDQTFAYMRSEYYLGNGITSRDSRDKWVKAGSKDAATRAREMVNNLLSQTDEAAIPGEVDRAIRQKYNIHMHR